MINFKNYLKDNEFLPLIGVYDVFSALIATRHFDGVFISGYSFAASSYGLPDIGFVNWKDIVDMSIRVRHVLPDAPILVDVDDGFGDEIVAANTVSLLEKSNLSAVMLEDQKRPRRCGHFDGKLLLPIEEYLVKLKAVLEKRKEIFVIARSDATDPEEGIDRALAYAEAGADGVMIEGIGDLKIAERLVSQVSCPVMVNQLHGGKTPNWSFDELKDAGVQIAIYSTPCLYAAQYGIEKYLSEMSQTGFLPKENTVEISDCTELLNIAIS